MWIVFVGFLISQVSCSKKISNYPLKSFVWSTVGKKIKTPSAANLLTLNINQGTPYLSYQTNLDDSAVFMYTPTSGWVTLGILSGALQPALFVDNGIPFVACASHLYHGRALVQAFNGKVWVPVGTPGFSFKKIRFPIFSVHDGTHILYETLSGKLLVEFYQHYNGYGWTQIGSPGSSATKILPSLSVSMGIPYVAYASSKFKNSIMIKMFKSHHWESMGTLEVSNGPVNNLTLSVEHNISYLAYENSKNQPSVLFYKENTWSPLTNNLTNNSVRNLCLFINNNTPYIAYTNKNTLQVREWNKSRWISIGPSNFSQTIITIPNKINKVMSLVIAHHIPYVSYIDKHHEIITLKLGPK